jgi:hypothetical protein
MSAGESCLRGKERGFMNPAHEKGDPLKEGGVRSFDNVKASNYNCKKFFKIA